MDTTTTNHLGMAIAFIKQRYPYWYCARKEVQISSDSSQFMLDFLALTISSCGSYNSRANRSYLPLFIALVLRSSVLRHKIHCGFVRTTHRILFPAPCRLEAQWKSSFPELRLLSHGWEVNFAQEKSPGMAVARITFLARCVRWAVLAAE